MRRAIGLLIAFFGIALFSSEVGRPPADKASHPSGYSGADQLDG